MMPVYQKVTDPKYNCPNCGHDVLIGKAAQIMEDACDMWFQCQRCGHDPSGFMDHVMTVWGWQAEEADNALRVWMEAIENNQSSIENIHVPGGTDDLSN